MGLRDAKVGIDLNSGRHSSRVWDVLVLGLRISVQFYERELNVDDDEEKMNNGRLMDDG
jgi:hypothetical protein